MSKKDKPEIIQIIYFTSLPFVFYYLYGKLSPYITLETHEKILLVAYFIISICFFLSAKSNLKNTKAIFKKIFIYLICFIPIVGWCISVPLSSKIKNKFEEQGGYDPPSYPYGM